jgi:hypothetical protein
METINDETRERLILTDTKQAEFRKRGRPKGPSGKVCLDARVTFRCTEQKKAWIENQAKMSHLSLGDWLRQRLLS